MRGRVYEISFLQMIMGLRRAKHLLKVHSVRLDVEPSLCSICGPFPMQIYSMGGLFEIFFVFKNFDSF